MDEVYDQLGDVVKNVTDSYSSELFNDYELELNSTDSPNLTESELISDYAPDINDADDTGLQSDKILETLETTTLAQLAEVAPKEDLAHSIETTDSPSSAVDSIVETFSNITSAVSKKLEEIVDTTLSSVISSSSTTVESTTLPMSSITTQGSVMPNTTAIFNVTSSATMAMNETMNGITNVTEPAPIGMTEPPSIPYETLHEVKTLLSNSSGQRGVNQEFISKMDAFLKGISGPDYMSLNNSLCETYLPTLDEAPAAMGTMGIVLWILGSAITLSLIVLLGKHCYFIYRTAHKVFRLHIFYVNSIFMVMALLTSIGTGVPRAHGVCSAIKDIYMSIGVAHFVDLTIAMYGGENAMAHYVKDRLIDIKKVPLLCCCLCVPGCIPTKRAINLLKWLVWQMKWSQFAYYLLRLIILYSVQNSLGMVDSEATYGWLNIVNLFSFLPGVAALFLLSALVTEDLQERYNYSIKEKVVRLTILTTKLQRILFDILEGFGVFPCYPPYVSSKFYKNILKDFIYLVEVLLLGILSYIAYSRRGEFERGTTKDITRKNFSKNPEQHEGNGYRDALSQRGTELPESAC